MPQPPSAHICLQFPYHVLWLERKCLIYDFAECQARVAGGAHVIAFQEPGYLEQGWVQGLSGLGYFWNQDTKEIQGGLPCPLSSDHQQVFARVVLGTGPSTLHLI